MTFFVVILYLAALPLLIGVSGIPEFLSESRRRTGGDGPDSGQRLGLTSRMAEIYASVSRIIASPIYSVLRCTPRAFVSRFAASGLFFVFSVLTALGTGSPERDLLVYCTAAFLLFLSVFVVYFGFLRGAVFAATGAVAAGVALSLLARLRAENQGAALLVAAAGTFLLLLLSRDYLRAAHRTYYFATTGFLRGDCLISVPFSLLFPPSVRLVAVELDIAQSGHWEQHYFLDAPNCLRTRAAALGGALLGFVAERYSPEVTYYFLMPQDTDAGRVELMFHDFRRESLSVSFPAEDCRARYLDLLPTQEELFENYNRLLLENNTEARTAELVFDLSFSDRDAANRFAAGMQGGGKTAELAENTAPDGKQIYTVLLTERLSLSCAAVTARCRELLYAAHAAGGELSVWYTANGKLP